MATALFIAPDAPAPPPLAFGTGLSLASSHPLEPPLSPHFVSGGCPRWRRRGRGRQWRWRRGGGGGKGGGGGNGGGEGPAAHYTAIWRMYVSAPPATPMADIRHAHLCSHSLACLGPA